MSTGKAKGTKQANKDTQAKRQPDKPPEPAVPAQSIASQAATAPPGFSVVSAALLKEAGKIYAIATPERVNAQSSDWMMEMRDARRA